MKKIIIMGAGAFGSEAVWVLEEMNKSKGKSNQWEILGYVDDNTSYKNKFFYDYKNLGPPEKVAIQYSKYELWYFCAIGNNKVREEIVQRFDKFEWKAATLIHPSVIIARNVSIGIGSYIGAGSILCPNVTIGKHVIINVRAAIGHDSILDNFSQINPGAQINGGCRIGQGAMVGSNASILPGKSIGNKASVGANSQVLRNVKAGSTVNGVPATVLAR